MPTQTAAYVDAIRHLPAGAELIVSDVSWDEYEQLLRELGDGYAVRVAYDRGRLEIVTLSQKHERYKDLILAVARILAEELGTGLESFGSTTVKQELLKQGAEPDTCFYVQRAENVIGKDDVDLAVYPPDVVVEVDVSHSSVKKMTFYARLGVPEVWRYDGNQVWMYRLIGTGYREVPASESFPGFKAETLSALLGRIRTEGQQAVLEAFRRSLRSD